MLSRVKMASCSVSLSNSRLRIIKVHLGHGEQNERIGLIDKGEDTDIAIASAVVVVDGCDSHPDSGYADGQHTPVGGKHEPDGVVVTIEATSFF